MATAHAALQLTGCPLESGQDHFEWDADSKTLFVTTETGVFTYASRCAGVR